MDPHYVQESIHDAMLDYLQRPWRFNPSRGGSLRTYLLMAASRNVSNMLRSARRCKVRDAQWLRERERLADNPCLLLDGIGQTQGTRLETRLSGLSRREQQALAAWLDGETRTDVLASLLEDLGAPGGDPRRLVKRFKDKMIKRIQRHAVRSAAPP
jgi:DNA-directed RNA polymerase specialized sigma24 family protein